jgi:hypothetical protein
MVKSPPSHTPHQPHARWRRLAVGALALTAAAVPVALGGASSALASSLPTPPLTILTPHATAGQGDIFISPFGEATTYANGPEILNGDGTVIWSKAVPAGEEASDFRTQTYKGQPVLTWWQGTGLGGLSTGTDYIYNDHYQQIATVNAGNGLSADGHEFLITPQNTALIVAYKTATANLTSIDGPADQTVIDGVVQEIDIATGKVLFQWNSADHVPYSQSEQPLPASAGTPWDWFHVNAVKLDYNGNLLIDARDTWTTYEVNRTTGKIVWQLGGRDSSFTLQAAAGQVLNNANELVAWQHDPQPIGNDEYTFFDNEAAGAGNTGSGSSTELPYSRAVTVKLNVPTHTATLLASDNQPEGLSAPSQGNAQTTANGSLFVGWGSLPYISEFDPNGNLLFNAEFPTGVNTYRAYLLPWKGEGSGGQPSPSWRSGK